MESMSNRLLGLTLATQVGCYVQDPEVCLEKVEDVPVNRYEDGGFVLTDNPMEWVEDADVGIPVDVAGDLASVMVDLGRTKHPDDAHVVVGYVTCDLESAAQVQIQPLGFVESGYNLAAGEPASIEGAGMDLDPSCANEAWITGELWATSVEHGRNDCESVQASMFFERDLEQTYVEIQTAFGLLTNTIQHP